MTTLAPSASGTPRKQSRSAPPKSGATAPIATWYCVKGSNDTYWRVEVPAKAIGAKVNMIPFATGRRELDNPGVSADRSFRWYETEEGAGYPDHEGAAVFTRPDQARAAHALTMRADGARVVAETDDNYFAPRDQNIAMRIRHDNDSARLFRDAIACFDALVTTTKELRDQVWKALKPKQRAQLEFHICGNHLDPDHWPDPIPPRDDGKLRVGWMGSDSHFRDIKLAYPALKWAADQGHEVVLIGYDPRWHPQSAVTGIGGLKRGERFGFPYTLIPWVDPAKFERPRVAWPLDIALAPLERTTFNLGKSDVKVLEYAMSGAAVIASNIEVYNRTIRHGETGFLAGGREELLYWTRELCTNARLRKDTAAAVAAYAREERTIHKHTREWLDAVCP